VISTSSGPVDRIKDALRGAQRLLEQLLHPWRRRRALTQLGSAPQPVTVLMVCHGNICRSPYAAVKARALIPAGAPVRVESAGFIGPHRGAPGDAVAVAAARGVDLRRHRSRLLTSASVGGADLVVVMEPRQRAELHRQYGPTKRPVLLLGDLDTNQPATRAIRDPVEQPRQVFAEVYERIDRCLQELIRVTWVERGTS